MEIRKVREDTHARTHARTHTRRTTTDTGLLKRSGADLSRARWTLTGQSVKGDWACYGADASLYQRANIDGKRWEREARIGR